jgi:hypothetical protein
MCMYVCVHGCEHIVCVYYVYLAIMYRVGVGDQNDTLVFFCK